MQSTTIIAFDHHAATTVAAVLLPGQRTPARHSLSSDLPTIQRFVGRLQRRGPGGAPAAVIAHAWTAQQRLYRRFQRLAARDKPKQHIVTAVARELTGFVWAALTR